MLDKGFLARERLIAIPAGVQTIVYRHMARQVRLDLEPSVAQVAGVRAFPRMHYQRMLSKRHLRKQLLAAYIANVLLSCAFIKVLGFPMVTELHLVHEFLTTVGTAVGRFAMGPLVMH